MKPVPSSLVRVFSHSCIQKFIRVPALVSRNGERPGAQPLSGWVGGWVGGCVGVRDEGLFLGFSISVLEVLHARARARARAETIIGTAGAAYLEPPFWSQLDSAQILT